MTSDDDDVDYMSDAFLENICGKEDIRPGLIKCHAQRYDHRRAANKAKADEHNRLRNPSTKEKETASREDGLNKPLDSNNVGFKMLQKLGFKTGSGLGRSGEGRVEPISVEVKTDRQGLGRKSSLEEIARLRARFRAEVRERMLNVDNYRERKAEQAAERMATVDLMKSQRVCWQLDSKENIEEPAETWFWPTSKLPNFEEDDCDEEEEGEDIDNKAHNSTSENAEDNPNKSEDEEVGAEENELAEEKFTVQEQLEMLTLYLRRTYLYCVWCGLSFDDERDLQQECPGPTREDH